VPSVGRTVSFLDCTYLNTLPCDTHNVIHDLLHSRNRRSVADVSDDNLKDLLAQSFQ
jgi:hypothetical protein